MHEGVWWHRAELVTVMAALQLNCAEAVRAALEVAGISTDPASSVQERLLAQGPLDDFDPIYEVVPSLRSSAERGELGAEGVSDLISVTKAQLLARPSSQAFGPPDEEPGVIVELVYKDAAGGWDPPLGVVLVTLERLEHEVAGESLKVSVNPGYLPRYPYVVAEALPGMGTGYDEAKVKRLPGSVLDDEELVAEALRLVAFTHSEHPFSLAPSWEVTGRTVSTTIILPRIAISASGIDNRAGIVANAVDSCVSAIAKAAIESPSTFPAFDRSQVNLTKMGSGGSIGRTGYGSDSAMAVWPHGRTYE